tara:strand:+ start:1905 stop:2096 length:192 start_codon:yes stop_codon:yes gene_type:complete
MKTIKQIISRLNDLEINGKQIQKEHGSSYWLSEVSKYEDLFCLHPDSDKTCISKTDSRLWVMK